jgi:hypothetical protein
MVTPPKALKRKREGATGTWAAPTPDPVAAAAAQQPKSMFYKGAPRTPLAPTVAKTGTATAPTVPAAQDVRKPGTPVSVQFLSNGNVMYNKKEISQQEYQQVQSAQQRGSGAANVRSMNPAVSDLIGANLQTEIAGNKQRADMMAQMGINAEIASGQRPMGASPEDLAQLGQLPQEQPMAEEPGINFNGTNISKPALAQIGGYMAKKAALYGMGGAVVAGPVGAVGGLIAAGVDTAFFAYNQIGKDEVQDVKIARQTFNKAADNNQVFRNMANAGADAQSVIQAYNENEALIRDQYIILKRKSETAMGQDLSKAKKDMAVIQDYWKVIQPYERARIYAALAQPDPSRVEALANYYAGDYGDETSSYGVGGEY